MAAPITLRLAEAHWGRIFQCLFSGDGKESVVLALCGSRISSRRETYCIHDIVEVPNDRCAMRTPSTVKWESELLVPVLERSLKRGLHILKLHSHPTGYNEFSSLDDNSDHALANYIQCVSDGQISFLSAFMTPDGMLFARMIGPHNGLRLVSQTHVVSDTIQCLHKAPLRQDGSDLRTRQAFGDGTTNLLRSLTIGIVGCSGTGSWVVEILARLGIGRLVLVDPDFVEAKNLNRIVNSTLLDAQEKRPKVDVLAKAIEKIGLGTEVEAHHRHLACPDVVKCLAECDFLFGCMDSADGRELLNRIATYYVIPYIDVGVRIDADGNGGVSQICCATHYLIPGGSSLLSRGAIGAEQVYAQALRRSNPEQYGALMKNGYIKGADIDRPAVISLNGFAATHAVNEMLARLHPFRRDANGEFRYQVFSLSEGEWLRLPDGPTCSVLNRFVGRGDCQPLLGSPGLS